jgi:radical SAM protein with 4Fe4S-binding SPASM domain
MREFIIEPKRDPEQEYTIHLFEFCNLSCSFCWQNHQDKIGIDTVLNKLEPIEKFISREFKNKVTLNIMGGEVFAPSIYSTELNEAYKQLSLGISQIAKKYNKSYSLNWVSNLVTDKKGIDQIEDLLKYSKDNNIPARLTTSYDPRGRFNKIQFEIFKSNVDYFGDRVTCFSCLLTKPNIEYYLNNGDEYFDYLYNSGKYIYFDYYMPDEHAKFNMPSDELLLKFFKHCVDNYPHVHPVKDWIFNKKNYSSCRVSKLVLADGTLCMCGNLVQDKKSLSMYKSPIKRMDNSIIENKFLEKYNCVSCEFLDRCTLGCFMNHDYRYREELDECVYKLTHRYIEDVRLQRNYIAS